MNSEQFSDFQHAAVHELMRLNKRCEEAFLISSWSRWDYDLERGTLTFSQGKILKVVASIQVVGTLPTASMKSIAKFREFGETENLPELKGCDPGAARLPSSSASERKL
jgi:hypothetical protein